MSLCCQIYPAPVPEDWGPGHGQHHWWAAWKSLEEPCRWDTAWNLHTHPVPPPIWRPKALPAPKISETKHTFKNFGQPVNSWIFSHWWNYQVLNFYFLHECIHMFMEILPSTRSIWQSVSSPLGNHLCEFSGMTRETRSKFLYSQWNPN